MFTKRNQPETARATETISTGAQTGYMTELDAWLNENLIEPIEYAIETGDAKDLHVAFSDAKQLLKRKVLAS